MEKLETTFLRGGSGLASVKVGGVLYPIEQGRIANRPRRANRRSEFPTPAHLRAAQDALQERQQQQLQFSGSAVPGIG